ncbi:hypothetical protein PG997_002529 [Apiospora hydei]|uniref:Integral membrane protein n=1 Tax=Apiospora hydei TaxID=1337664 RepID=A0ABR1WWS0_9PEZI
MSTPDAPPLPDWYLQQDKGPSILAAIITVTVIGTIFTVARLYVRQFIRGKLRIDDYLILVSMLCGYVSVAFGVLAVKSGNGKHFVLLDTAQKEGVIFWTMPQPAASYTPMDDDGPVRHGADRRHLYAVFPVLAALVAVGSIDNGEEMHHEKKIGLSVALGIGSIASIIAIYKCTGSRRLPAQTFHSGPSHLATSVEGNSLITATCIPILKPLGDKLLGSRAFSSNDSKRRRYHDHPDDNKDPIQTIGSGDDPDADLLVTTCQDRAETESQEEILSCDQKGLQDGDRNGGSDARGRHQQYASDDNTRASQLPTDGISKTTVVAVTYGQGQPGDAWGKEKRMGGPWPASRVNTIATNEPNAFSQSMYAPILCRLHAGSCF